MKMASIAAIDENVSPSTPLTYRSPGNMNDDENFGSVPLSGKRAETPASNFKLSKASPSPSQSPLNPMRKNSAAPSHSLSLKKYCSIFFEFEFDS